VRPQVGRAGLPTRHAAAETGQLTVPGFENTYTISRQGNVLPGDEYSAFDGAVFDVPKGKTPLQLTYGADPKTSASEAISFKFPIDTTYSPSPPKGFVFPGGLLWKDIVFFAGRYLREIEMFDGSGHAPEKPICPAAVNLV
jgi:hypothetical protein